MEQQPLNGVMSTTMEKIKEMIDVNTIIGEPITAPNGTIAIPVSKVSFGFAAGGSDFNGKASPRTNFGGGSGAGVTISPVAFLVITEKGVRMVPVAPGEQPLEKAAAMLPEVIEKISALFKKDKKKGEEDAPAPAEKKAEE